MIAKQIKGTGFRGALNYLLGKEDAQIIGGNMIADNPKALAQEFKISRELRPNLNKVVYHASLSLPLGEALSNEQWSEVSNKYMHQMGFEGSQFVVIRHHDTEHHHIHILASRVRLDGSVVDDSQDYKRSESVVRKLELEYGLSVVPSSRDVQSRAPTTGELHKGLREQVPSTKMQLRSIIDVSTQDRPTATEFIKRMEVLGVQVVPNVASTGHISGISFVLENEKMKGSDLGRKYTWLGLTKGVINYEQNRDFKFIEQRSRENNRQPTGQSKRHQEWKSRSSSRPQSTNLSANSIINGIYRRNTQVSQSVQNRVGEIPQICRGNESQRAIYDFLLGIEKGSRDSKSERTFRESENEYSKANSRRKKHGKQSQIQNRNVEKTKPSYDHFHDLLRLMVKPILATSERGKKLESLFGKDHAEIQRKGQAMDARSDRKGEKEIDPSKTPNKNKKGRGMDFGF